MEGVLRHYYRHFWHLYSRVIRIWAGCGRMCEWWPSDVCDRGQAPWQVLFNVSRASMSLHTDRPTGAPTDRSNDRPQWPRYPLQSAAGTQHPSLLTQRLEIVIESILFYNGIDVYCWAETARHHGCRKDVRSFDVCKLILCTIVKHIFALVITTHDQHRVWRRRPTVFHLYFGRPIMT